MCGSDRAQDKERRRAGEREPRRKIRHLLGTGVAPNRLSSEQASNRNKKGAGGWVGGKRMMRKLQFWCSHEGDICCSISNRRFRDLNTWKF